MMPGRLSIALMILIALLTSEGAMARDGGGHGGGFGGGHGGGFGGGHGGGFGGFHRGGFSGVPGGAFRGGHVGGGHFGGFHHHGHGGVGLFVGSPFFWPDFYYWPYYSFQPYYSSPTLITPSIPPTYIEQGTVSAVQPLEPNSWDYCSDPAGYYPYVKECPAGWQTIEPQPIEQQPGYWYYCTSPPGYYPYVRECSTVWQNVVP